MKIKNLILLLVPLFILNACLEVKFAEPQPQGIKNLDVFPKEFQGQFLIGDKDTLNVFENGFEILNDTNPSKDQFTISDNFVLRKWRKTFFINIKEKKDSVWTVIFLKPSKTNTKIGNLIFKEKETDKIKVLKKITGVKEVLNENGNVDYLLIQPSRRELKKILRKFPLYDLGTLKEIEK